MISWNQRVPEVANLLNPSFCGLILYSSILEYQGKENGSFPISLIYLVLPIVLHKDTRAMVNSRKNMIRELQNNPQILVGFADRAKSLIPFANEAIEYLLANKAVECKGNGFTLNNKLSQSKILKYLQTDGELRDCYNKASHVGRWFKTLGSVENIYYAWGVKP